MKSHLRWGRNIARSLGIASLALLASGAPALADTYPSQPTRFIVGFSPGGPVDVGARIIAEELTRTMGQPFVVENRVGANAMIAAQAVKQADPNGYTVFVSSSSAITLNPHLFKSTIRYNPEEDFRPVAAITEMPLLLVVNTSDPLMKDVHNLQDLVTLAKTMPGKLTYGSAGVGNLTQLAFELLSSRAGISLTHIPYKGTASAQTAILSKEVNMAFDSQSAIPHIKNGTLRALAVSSSRRTPALPDVPTVQELGYGDFEMASWVGLFAPKATPDAVVQKLSDHVLKALQTPAVAERLSAQGPVLPLGAADFDKKVKKETADLLGVIKTANIKIEQ